jgi:hypothetical protein
LDEAKADRLHHLQLTLLRTERDEARARIAVKHLAKREWKDFVYVGKSRHRLQSKHVADQLRSKWPKLAMLIATSPHRAWAAIPMHDLRKVLSSRLRAPWFA